MKLSPALLMEHTRRAILRDGVQQIVAYGNTGDTWIIDVTAGHMTALKLQQLRTIAMVDAQDMGRITRLVLAFSTIFLPIPWLLHTFVRLPGMVVALA